MKSKQLSFFFYASKTHTKSKSSKFLDEMDKEVPWDELVALIERHIPKNHRGRKRKDTELMLRSLCLAQWYNPSDPGLEDGINDRISLKGNQYYFGMKAHVGVDMKHGVVHSLTVTTPKVYDSKELENLLHGEEEYVKSSQKNIRF